MTAHAGDEAYLEGAASTALGGAQVLAAGIFSWNGLLGAQTVGVVGGATGADLLTGGNAAAGAVGAALGGRAAVEATAAAKGMTVALLVAVTEDAIVVLNWNGDSAGTELHRFDRSATDVHISKLGLSRVVTLHDPATDERFELHGSTAPFSAQSKPDKLVMHLLSAG